MSWILLWVPNFLYENYCFFSYQFYIVASTQPLHFGTLYSVLIISTPLLFTFQQYFNNRLKHVQSQYTTGGNPYPHKFQVSIQVPKYVAKYEGIIEPGQQITDQEVSIAGNL